MNYSQLNGQSEIVLLLACSVLSGGYPSQSYDRRMLTLAASVTDSPEFASALAGAFVGAISAAFLTAIWGLVRDRSAKHEALNRALYALAMQANDLIFLERKILPSAKQAAVPGRDLQTIIYMFTDLRLNPGELTFLANSASPRVLADILVAEAHWKTLVSAVHERNQLLNELADRISPSGGDFEKGLFSYDLAGPNLVKGFRIKKLGETIVDDLPEIRETLEKALINFAAVAKEFLPEKDFIKIVPSSATGKPQAKVI